MSELMNMDNTALKLLVVDLREENKRIKKTLSQYEQKVMPVDLSFVSERLKSESGFPL